MDSDAEARLKQAAGIIRDRAKELSSWSVQIPASLEISIEGDSAVLRANPQIAPQARAFELGLRHPLNYENQQRNSRFGRTPHRPFLEPAVDQTADKAAERCAEVITDWTRKLGYK